MAKAYVITTGTVFTLIALAHVARVVAEGPRLARDPWFLFTSVLSISLAAWAWRVFRGLGRPAGKD